jgi:toxin ParE1/3/4
MKVRYTLEALDHLDAISDYIGARNPIAARRVLGRIRAAAERLGEFPNMGHAGLVPGTSEWSVRGLPYVIVHQVDGDAKEWSCLACFTARRIVNIPETVGLDGLSHSSGKGCA